MDLFTLSAKLGLDTSGYESGVRGAVESGKSLGEKLTSTFEKIKKAATFALSAAAIKKGIDSMLNLANEVSAVGDKIDKQSQALGLSRKAYQEWDYILSQSGSSIDSLGVSMKTLNTAILSAADGGKEAKSAFAQLGLGIHEIENLNMEDQFEAVVRAFQEMPAGAKKSALAVQLFGKNGMELLPLLNSSSTSIDELRQKAEELGLIMGDDAIDASVAYNDAMDDMKRTFNALKYSIGSQLLPAMTNGMTKITNYAGKLRKAYSENGLAGVASTLVQDFKNIKWPSWSDVKNAATIAWNSIVEGANGLAKVVFGENIEFPDINTMVSDFSAWWTNTAQPALQNAMSWTLQLFGMPTEDADAISKIVGDWWGNKVETAQSVLKWALNLPAEPYDAGSQLHDIIVGWWDGVVETAQSLLHWALGIPTMEDEDGTLMGEAIEKWWDEKVVPLLIAGGEYALDFTLGLFGLPSARQMAEDIKNWWNNEVLPSVGSLSIFGVSVEHAASAAGSSWNKAWSNVGSLFGTGSSSNDFGGGTSSGNGAGRTFETPNAKGMWDVPYDDYATRLHRGEMVLNASRARDYREGNDGGIDTASLISAITQAVRAGMQGVTVKSYLNGRDITDDVNRNTAQQLKARRFAT